MDTLPPYNLVDILAVALLLLGVVQGLIHGLSKELAGFVSTILAIGGAWFFYVPLGERLYEATRLGPHGAYALAFFLLVFGVYLVTLMVRIVLRHIMDFAFKGVVERLGGALCGLVRAVILVGGFIFLFSLWPHEYLHQVFAEQSLVGRTLNRYVPTVYDELADRYPGLPRFGKPEECEPESEN